MKTLSAAIQSIVDADTHHPLTTVVITLTDDTTILRVATRSVTIASNVYQPDLITPPLVRVSAEQGIDHVQIQLNDTDFAYSFYDNADKFDGAAVTVQEWFSDDGTYAPGSIVGPVESFIGFAVNPSGNGTIFTFLVQPITEDTIGRTITNKCLNDFRDGACGYTYSATIATGGTYPAGNDVPISETAVAGQSGIAMSVPVDFTPKIGFSEDYADRVKIMRGSTQIEPSSGVLYLTSVNLGTKNVQFNQAITVLTGDTIQYVDCTRDTMLRCARRWQIGNATRQQDNFLGITWHHEEYLLTNFNPPQGIVVRYGDVQGSMVPIGYGQRWIEPLVAYLHAPRSELDNDWVEWNANRSDPIVVGLISEGPVEEAIVGTDDQDRENYVELDGTLLSQLPFYGDAVFHVGVRTGTYPQTPYNVVAAWDNSTALPAQAGHPGIATFFLRLPEDYEIESQNRSIVKRVLSFNLPPEIIRQFFPDVPSALFSVTPYFDVLTKPGIRVYSKMQKVYTWSYVVSTPTRSASTAFSRNPVWQILDLVTRGERIASAPSTIYGMGLDWTSDIDIASFMLVADYADDQINVGNARLTTTTLVDRYNCDVHITSDNRDRALETILQTFRGQIVRRNGKIGLVADMPLGGKGTLTGVSAATLTDADRTDDTKPTIPSFPDGGLNGGLEGLTCQMLDGAAVGLTRKIVSNTKDSWTLASAFSPLPSVGDSYAIYAVALDEANSGEPEISKLVTTKDIPNKIVVEFESDEHNGRTGTVPIFDTVEDSGGKTHAQRWGTNERSLRLDGITTWQQAVRQGWYELRRGLDLNRWIRISDVNIEALPIEVGDVVLLNHTVRDIQNDMMRVERVERMAGEHRYVIEGRFYREHLYADWPNDEFASLDITSGLTSPHSIPPHVQNLAYSVLQEDDGEPPQVTLTWDLPYWPYAGWRVIIESRWLDPSTSLYTDWEVVATSQTASASFRVAKVADYEVRAIFTSHVGVRADAPIVLGTSTGGNTSTTLNDTSRNWITDQWVNWVVEITSGAADGEDSTITSNTDTQLTFAPAMATVPGADNYQIVNQATVLPISIATGTITNVSAKLWAQVDSANGTADLYLQVFGPLAFFPVVGTIYQEDPEGTALQSHSFTLPGDTIGPVGSGKDAEYASLTDIALPDVGPVRWWAKLVDDYGAEYWGAFTMADRDLDPGGSVSTNDFRADAMIVCRYDDDVSQIVIDVPTLTQKTYSGLSGGGKIVYTVGDALDSGPPESLLNPGEERDPYTVDYTGGSKTVRMWEGALHGANTAGVVAGRLRADVDAVAGTCDLYLQVTGDSSAFNVTADIYQNDPSSPAIQSHTFTASGQEIGPGTYPSLDNITLPRVGATRFWAKLTTTDGLVFWSFTMADRNTLPDGSVSLDDFQAQPIIYISYDDDVAKIILTTPSGPKTWTSLSGGGLVSYQVGVTSLDSGTESDLDYTETRTGYKVVVYADNTGGTSQTLFEGPLHGGDPPLPTIDASYVAGDELWTVDITVVVDNTDGAVDSAGTLKVWTAPNSRAFADPTGTPDASLSVTTSPQTFGPGSSAALDEVPLGFNLTKGAFFEYVNEWNASSGIIQLAMNRNPFDPTGDGIPLIDTSVPGSWSDGSPFDLGGHDSGREDAYWEGWVSGVYGDRFARIPIWDAAAAAMLLDVVNKSIGNVQAESNVTDSTGVAIDKSFKKPLSSSANTLDSVGDGVSWRRLTGVNASNQAEGSSIAASVITGTHLLATTLFAIFGEIGTLYDGIILDLSSSPNSAIKMSTGYDPPGGLGSVNAYIDMTATGTGVWLKCGSNFSVTAAGAITASSGTFSGSLSGATGTFAGSLTADNVEAKNLKLTGSASGPFSLSPTLTFFHSSDRIKTIETSGDTLEIRDREGTAQTLLALTYNGTTVSAIAYGGWQFLGAVEIDGALNHDGTTVGLFGTAPASQPADIGALTDSSGGSADGTVAAVSGSGADATINDNFADVTAKINALRTAIRTLGITA